jgi:hypothetical protein
MIETHGLADTTQFSAYFFEIRIVLQLQLQSLESGVLQGT